MKVSSASVPISLLYITRRSFRCFESVIEKGISFQPTQLRAVPWLLLTALCCCSSLCLVLPKNEARRREIGQHWSHGRERPIGLRLLQASIKVVSSILNPLFLKFCELLRLQVPQLQQRLRRTHQFNISWDNQHQRLVLLCQLYHTSEGAWCRLSDPAMPATRTP